MNAEQPDQFTEWFVFISHSGDIWIAQKVAEEIRSCGAQTFIAEVDLQVGDNIDGDIFSLLKSGKVCEVVLLLSPRALASLNVGVEVGAANIRDIPVRVLVYGQGVDEADKHPKLPKFLRQTAMVHLDDSEKYFNELKGRIADHRKRIS
jgi:hypothetical protein